MSFLDWFTRNWADTDEAGSTVRPIDLPVPPAEAVALLQKAIAALPLWQVESLDAHAGTIHATRRTRLWRFTDDIWIRLEASAGGTRVHARSKARVGRGDLGQNRRNLLELFQQLVRRKSESRSHDVGRPPGSLPVQ
jgi:uncharacterized protein (DUF1499 family)